MAVRIRLARHGSKKKPFYRIVVARSESPRDGRFIEQVGIYDPTRSPAVVEFKADKLTAWLSKGAQPTQTVAQLIRRAGVSTTTP
jgi:small subunit ribosomal protein S16